MTDRSLPDDGAGFMCSNSKHISPPKFESSTPAIAFLTKEEAEYAKVDRAVCAECLSDYEFLND